MRDTVKLTSPLKDIVEEIYEEIHQNRRTMKDMLDDFTLLDSRVLGIMDRVGDLEKKFFELISGDTEGSE